MWISVLAWDTVRYTDYCGHLSTLYANQYIPRDILTRFNSQRPSLCFRKVGLFVNLNTSPPVIHRLWNRYDKTGQFTRRVGQGRGRMTTPQDDWNLIIFAFRRRSATARELQPNLRRVTGVTVSDQTVMNRVKEVSLRPRGPLRVPRLTQQHRAARLLFARSHVNCQLR
jgi:Transposase.